MKNVESISVSKSDIGIIELIINTKEKWVNYHQYNDSEYRIEDPEGTDELSNEVIKIDEKELGLSSVQKYFRSHCQNKDQIIYLWIPYSLLRTGRISKSIDVI